MKSCVLRFALLCFAMLTATVTATAADALLVSISGAEKMTFGPTPDEAFSNPYSVTVADAAGTPLTEDVLSGMADFNVVWDIEGFKTANDTEGQYCDSYGAFTVNNQGQTATVFALRHVPMNFFGKMTATVTCNGTVAKAEKFVVALGDPSSPTGYVLPLGGYPANLSAYPAALLGYQLTSETYGKAHDIIIGGWCVAGSDGGKSAVLTADAHGGQYLHFSAPNMRKSHVMTQAVDPFSGQLLFKTRLRFLNAGAVVTLTGGNPFWLNKNYTCPVSLSFDGSAITLNGTAVASDAAAVKFTTGTWYDVVLSADKSSETCYAMVYDQSGQLLGQTDVVAWTETSSPTFFSVGMGNSNSGAVDMAAYEAFLPQPATDSFVLQTDKATLSIPNKESANLSVAIADKDGYPITGLATWTVLEEDMRQSVTITPQAADSHKATVTLSETAEAGTVTIQVSIGGSTKTIELSLTSSAEGIKFTESSTSMTIPLDTAETATARFAAIVIDGEGNTVDGTVTLAAYDKDGVSAFKADGISFDPATGVLSVGATASPVLLTIRATGKNSKGEELSKSVRVNIHGMKFDFGTSADDAVADGFTAVDASTAYNATSGYGMKRGTVTAGGTPSATDATTDYLEGAMEFDFKANKGDFYSVEITYQGVLTTGYINSDLAGYELGNSTTMTTATFTIPATTAVIDLRVANADATHVARLAQVTITKQAKRQKRQKRVVHHIGDSTSANNGSWAYRLKNLVGSTYPELDELCSFLNKGAGGRNLSTYYTQGKLAAVLRDIYPGDILMFGNNGTNGMGTSYEADMNYYLNAAEALGAQIIINSYTPHGAVSNYASGYNASTNSFDSYRRDSYETIVRRVASQRKTKDENYLGFVEIGKNADAAFNAYVADYAKNGYASKDAAAQAIIKCFTDHNHYSNGTLACDLMLNGYGDVKGIVAQLVEILSAPLPTGVGSAACQRVADNVFYTLSGQRVTSTASPGLYIKSGRKMVVR